MSKFIELTRRNTQGITVNVDHIATFQTKRGGEVYEGTKLVSPKGEVVTELMLAGPLPALAHIEVIESYEEIAKMVGLKL